MRVFQKLALLFVLAWMNRAPGQEMPVAWYRFDEGTGNVLHDRSGHGFDGSLAGPVWDRGVGGAGLRFAEGQYVDLGGKAAALLARDWTVSAWVCLDASPFPDENTNWTLLDHEVYRKSGSILRVDGATAKVLYRSSQEGLDHFGTGRTPLENGKAAFVTVTCHEGKGMLFLNGRPDGSFAAVAPAPGDAPLRIGSGSQSFCGMIFDLAVYGRALDSAAVAGLYWRDAARFGHAAARDQMRLTPHLYRAEREAYVEVDFLGVAPLAAGEIVALELIGPEGTVLDAKELKELPESLRQGFLYPLPAPGKYTVRVGLKGAARTQQTSVEFLLAEVAEAPPSPKARSAAPVPAPASTPEFSLVAAPGGALLLRIADKTVPVESAFSTPDGGWMRWTPGADGPASVVNSADEVRVEAANAFYKVKRSARIEGDRVRVRDTIENTSAEALGILVEHALDSRGLGQAHISLAGRETGRAVASRAINRCPGLSAGVPGAGVGLVPVDDVFLLQSRGAIDAERKLKLSTAEFAVDAHASYTLEWALYVNATGGYYDVANAIRRHEGRNNVRIPGSLALMQGTQHERSVSLVPDKPYFTLRNAAYSVVACLSWSADDPAVSLEGIEFMAYPQERARIRAMMDRLHAVAPEVKGMFHIAPQLYATQRPEQLWPDSRVTDAEGRQVVYGYNYENGSYFSKERYEANWRWWIYYPTLENSFGKALLDSVDTMMGEMGCQGVFADGFYWGYGGEYTYDRWDGHSADIDPSTHRLLRKKGSVLLLSQEAMLAWSRKIWDKGGVVVANGVVPSRTICGQPLIFDKEVTEGPDVVLLPTPATLGDPSLCNDEASTYKDVLNKLRWGNLYFYYNEPKDLVHESLPKYMYPITVQQAEPGCVRGSERIVTMNSGVYTWPGSKELHRVYRFDARGRRIDANALTTATVDSVRTQIELAPSESAVIERVPISIQAEAPVNAAVDATPQGANAVTLHGFGDVTLTSAGRTERVALSGLRTIAF